MKHDTIQPTDRLAVVDALRGFALLAIVLLHNLEHYNLFCIPQNIPTWLTALDKGVWDTIFFLFAGKAYATFSLLFGFSFYIQMRNSQSRGHDFRARFAWRMFVLFLFSQLHALFYNGDILLLYSVVGLVLIPVSGLKDRTVLLIAALCLIQPTEIAKIVYCTFNTDYVFAGNWWAEYAAKVEPIVKASDFWATLKSNISDGQLYSNFWQVEAGRVFQTAGLFMIGMLLGRGNYFAKSQISIKRWRSILCFSVILIIPMYLVKNFAPDLINNNSIKASFELVVYSLTNFVFMSLLVSGFTLLWFHKGDGYKFQRGMSVYGRMSLTNYITQSIIGVSIYYGFGLALYQSTGATASIAIAMSIFGLQLWWSRKWLESHPQGPLEYLWRTATWIRIK